MKPLSLEKNKALILMLRQLQIRDSKLLVEYPSEKDMYGKKSLFNVESIREDTFTLGIILNAVKITISTSTVGNSAIFSSIEEGIFLP